MSTETSIELYSKIQNPIEAIDKMGAWIARSNMFGCEREEQGKVLAMAMITENKSPFQLRREYHLINGQLVDKADSMLGKFRQAGGKHRVISRDEKLASVDLIYDGNTVRFSFAWADAEKEPFVWSYDKRTGEKTIKTNYATPRARTQMLWARVISEGVKTLAPEIVAGLEQESDAPEVAAEKTINMVPTTAPTVPAQPVKTEPIDVPSKVVPLPTQPERVSKTAPPSDEKELAAAGLSPVQPPAPAPAPMSDSHVTDEMVEDTYNALAGNFTPALRWMVREKWLKMPTSAIEGEDAAGIYIRDNLKSVTSVRVRKLLKNTASFLTAIKGAA